jgi:hypothetical protein
MAADPAAKPMATTKAFNLGLLGIIELLLMGRSTDTPLRARIRATQIRDAHSPPGSEAAKPCSIPHIHRAGRHDANADCPAGALNNRRTLQP